jgi:6-phosphogluconolactonase
MTGRSEGEPEIVVVGDARAAVDAAAERIAASLADAVAARGRADWATTGGSTVVGIYRALADTDLRNRVPWGAVHVWWGDDRYVPRDHPLSNVKPFDDIMLALAYTQGGEVGLGTIGAPTPVPIPLDQVHVFPTSAAIGEARGAAWCASQIANELRTRGPAAVDGWPVFDLLLLGVGPDGHLLSVFPRSPALASQDLALAVPAPTHVEPHVERVTLNPAIVGTARQVIAVVTGEAKAQVVGDVFSSSTEPSRLPAQLARRAGATWILDEAAASKLPR